MYCIVISGANNGALQSGILLINKCLITVFGVVEWDICGFSGTLIIEELHIQIVKCMLQFSQETVLWFWINQTEMRNTLCLLDEMQTVQRTAKVIEWQAIEHIAIEWQVFCELFEWQGSIFIHDHFIQENILMEYRRADKMF